MMMTERTLSAKAKYLAALAVSSSVLLQLPAMANSYTDQKLQLCASDRFYCIKVKRGQSWRTLWRDPAQRDVVRRINRINLRLRPGMLLAVPKDLKYVTVNEVSPFAQTMQTNGKKTILVDPKRLAWGAYDQDGKLVRWGPASLGKDYCADTGSNCRTVSGKFETLRKQGFGCVSGKYPIRKNGKNGGAPMYYCMHFYKGYAIHGSDTVPGYNASHGCVRVYTKDAKWLNQKFVNVYEKRGPRTQVIVREY